MGKYRLGYTFVCIAAVCACVQKYRYVYLSGPNLKFSLQNFILKTKCLCNEINHVNKFFQICKSHALFLCNGSDAWHWFDEKSKNWNFNLCYQLHAMQVREMVYRCVWNLCTSVHKTFSTDAGIISSELYEVCFV